MPAPTTWLCPRCGRRVPNRSGECHCGTTRIEAETVIARTPVHTGPRADRFSLRGLPRDIKILGGIVVLSAIGGLAWLIVPHSHTRTVPLLGFVDRLPSPTPMPTPHPHR
jgi:hypothetical protein